MAMHEGVTMWTCDSPGCSTKHVGTEPEPPGWGVLAFQAPVEVMDLFPDECRNDPVAPKDDVGKVELDLCPECSKKVGEFLLFLLKDGTAKLPKRRTKTTKEN